MNALQEVRGNNPPVTVLPCRGPLGKGPRGRGYGLPRALCALAMTGGFTWGAVRGRRRGEGIPPYGGLQEVRRGRRADVGIGPYGGLQEVRWGGRTEGRPPLRSDKRRGA